MGKKVSSAIACDSQVRSPVTLLSIKLLCCTEQLQNRLDYITKLWKFNQPSDSHAIRLNRDITPSKLNGIVYFYFKSQVLYKNLIWDDHHGSQIYLKQYFLLLLMRAFCQTNFEKYKQLIDSSNIPKNLDSDRLYEIKCFLDEYIEVAEKLKQSKDRLKDLGFNVKKIEQYIDDGIIPLLESFKIKIDKRLDFLERKTPISKKKVEEFKKEIINTSRKEYSLNKIMT